MLKSRIIWRLGLLAGLIVVAILGLWWLQPPPVPTTDAERLQRVRAALAATEDLDTERAETLWDEVRRGMPDDPDAHPRNLLVALQATRYAIQAEDELAARFVRRTATLAEPLDKLVRRATEPLGKSPQQLAESIASAAESGDWDDARSAFALWRNVLVASEMVRADRKRADPNPLDLLAFNTVHELSSRISREQQPAAGTAELHFEPSPPLDAEVMGVESVEEVALIDFDLSNTLDLLVAGEGKLSLLANDGDSFRQDSMVETMAGVRGIAVVDLFMVDGGGPARIRRFQSDPEMSEEEKARRAAEHETFPCVVVHGAEGIDLWRVDGLGKRIGHLLCSQFGSRGNACLGVEIPSLSNSAQLQRCDAGVGRIRILHPSPIGPIR